MEDVPEVLGMSRGCFTGEALQYTLTVGPMSFDIWNLPLKDVHGQVIGIVGVALNISKRVQMEGGQRHLQKEVITVQQETLRERSTPLIPIADDVLMMPLIGTIDTNRAQQMMETLLEGVAQRQVNRVIRAGVSVVDTQVVQSFIQTTQAVRLLGANVMLTGISLHIAQMLVHLGVDLSQMKTQASLQAGISQALGRKRAPEKKGPYAKRL